LLLVNAVQFLNFPRDIVLGKILPAEMPRITTAHVTQCLSLCDTDTPENGVNRDTEVNRKHSVTYS